VKKATELSSKPAEFEHVAPFAGLDATTRRLASNTRRFFRLPSPLQPRNPGVTQKHRYWPTRRNASIGDQAARVLNHPTSSCTRPRECGGSEMLEDRGCAGLGSEAPGPSVRAANDFLGSLAANKDPHFAGGFTFCQTGSPSFYADIDSSFA